MSSNADKEIFQSSVESYDNSVLFKEKKWTYITDNSSNGGVFSGQQIQWDLSQLSNNGAWVSLKECVIQIPLKLTITNTGSGNQQPSTNSIQSAVMKSGFFQVCDSLQLVIDGNTVATNQIYKNIETQFRILKDWSLETYNKLGPSLGIALDRTDTNNDTARNLANASLSSIAPSNYGVTATNVNAFYSNLGVKERLENQNNDAGPSSFQTVVLGPNAPNTGLSTVDSSAGASIPVGQDCYCQFVLATIRLRDICPFVESMPLTRNMRGFLYFNYNSFQTVLNTDGGGSIIAPITHTALAGRSNPAMWRVEDNTDSQTFYPSKTVAASWTFKIEPSGVKSTSRDKASPPISYAKLSVPYYTANPTIDSVLSQKKTFRYLEYQPVEFNLSADESKTITLSPGIANAKSVLLVPFFTTVNGTTVNPWTSCFDSAPATTSPYAALKSIQLQVGNVPIFNNPVDYSSDLFFQEIATNGIEGGLVNELSSGLLNSKLFKEWYRFHYINISRRIDTDDGCSRSIIVQCQNATTLPMKVIAFVHYEREVTVDTNTCQVFQGRM